MMYVLLLLLLFFLLLLLLLLGHEEGLCLCYETVSSPSEIST